VTTLKVPGMRNKKARSEMNIDSMHIDAVRGDGEENEVNVTNGCSIDRFSTDVFSM
jgi:hypothetical protein